MSGEYCRITDDPAIFVVGKIDTHECVFEICRDHLPGRTAVFGSQDRARLADDIAFVIVAKIDVIEWDSGSRVLLFPGQALVGRGKDHPAVADDPAVGIVVKIEMKKLGLGRHRDSPPRLAAVLGTHQERIDDHLIIAALSKDRSYDITAILIGKSYAQKFGRPAPNSPVR